MTPYQRKKMYYLILLKAYDQVSTSERLFICDLLESTAIEGCSTNIEDYPELMKYKPEVTRPAQLGWFPSWNTYSRIRILEKVVNDIKLPFIKEMCLSLQYGRKLAREQSS